MRVDDLLSCCALPRSGPAWRTPVQRVVVLSYYFEPDLSAGAFRMSALVRELAARLGPSVRVDVIASMPNRYRSYVRPTPGIENIGNIRITRIPVPRHRSGMLDQSRAFAAYARGARREALREPADLVFATSSRLMTAVLAAWVARRQSCPLYLDIRDTFTEVLADVLPTVMYLPLSVPLRILERFTLNTASRVNLVSAAFYEHFNAIRSDLDYRLFPNGIDEELIGADFTRRDLDGPRVLLYAGNVGEGQGLDRLVPDVAERLPEGWQLWVVGDGGRRERLEKRLEQMPDAPVRVIDPMPRADLISYYRRADALLLHLNDYPALKKVLPSKVFDYAATGKPILAGVSGAAREFLRAHVEGVVIFDPFDTQALVNGLVNLTSESIDRSDFIKRFRRNQMMTAMVDDVLDLL